MADRSEPDPPVEKQDPHRDLPESASENAARDADVSERGNGNGNGKEDDSADSSPLKTLDLKQGNMESPEVDALQDLIARAREKDGESPQASGRPPQSRSGHDSEIGEFQGSRIERSPFGPYTRDYGESGSRIQFEDAQLAPRIDGRAVAGITYHPGKPASVRFADGTSSQVEGELYSINDSQGNRLAVMSDASKVITAGDGSTETIFAEDDAQGRVSSSLKDGVTQTRFKDDTLKVEFEPARQQDGLRELTTRADGSFTATYRKDGGTLTIDSREGSRTETTRRDDGTFESRRFDLESGRIELTGKDQRGVYNSGFQLDEGTAQRTYEDGTVVTSFSGAGRAPLGADSIVQKPGEKPRFFKGGNEIQAGEAGESAVPVAELTLRDGSTRTVMSDGALSDQTMPRGEEEHLEHRDYEADAPGGLASEDIYSSQNGGQRIERRFDGTDGKTYETEEVDGDGRRLSITRDGRDEKGRFVERADSTNGLTERRWEDGSFAVTDTSGNVVSRGRSESFENGAEKGRVDIDEKTGQVVGIHFDEGPRKGQEVRIARGADGSVSAVSVSGPEGSASIKKEGDGWVPPDAKIPGLELQVEDGLIKGKFVFNEKGDIIYGVGDKSTQVLKAGGAREVYDFNEYSRKEIVDGVEKTTYWDGYKWREADQVSKDGGKTTVTFKPDGSDGPTSMTRDHESNSFTVDLAGGTRFEAHWNEQRMVRQQGENRTEIFNTGQVDESGKPLWREGEKIDRGDGAFDVRFKPLSAAEQKGQVDGATPYAVTIDGKSGKVYSRFMNGTTVAGDGRGHVDGVTYANGKSYQFERSADGRLQRVVDADGKIYERTGDDRYTVFEGGRKTGEVDASFTIGANGSFKMLESDGDAVVTEPNGRTTTYGEGTITSITDSKGQVWRPDKTSDSAPGPQNLSSSVWRVMGDDRSLTGEAVFRPDGTMAVKTEEGLFSRNPDRSTSRFNERNVEVERVYDNGAFIKRNDDGLLTQTGSKQGDVRDFKYEAGPDGVMRVSEVAITRAGQSRSEVVERLQEGVLREVAAGADGKPGKLVSYDPRNGARNSLEQDGSTIDYSDLHGSRQTLDRQGNVQQGELANPRDDSRMIFADGRLQSMVSADGKTKRTFRYDEENKDVPVEILESVDGESEPRSLGTLKGLDRGGNAVYENPESGAVTVYDRGIHSLAFARRTAEGVSGWQVDYPGGRTEITGLSRSDVRMVLQDGRIEKTVDSQGRVRDFIRENGKLIRVDLTTPGDPPVTTVSERADAGKENRLVDADGKIVEYDPITGARKAVEVDEGGAPSGSAETSLAGIVTRRDGAGTVTGIERPDGSVDRFENGKLVGREFENGSRLGFDPETGELVSSRDVYGNERRFEYTGSGDSRRLSEVWLKGPGDSEAKLTESLDGGILRVHANDKPEGEPVVYDMATGTRRQVHGFKEGRPESFTDTFLDGSTVDVGPGGEFRRSNKYEETREGSQSARAESNDFEPGRFARDTIAAQPQPEGELLPDGSARLTYRYADGTSRVETYDPVGKSLTVTMLDRDGKESGESLVTKNPSSSHFEPSRFMETARQRQPLPDRWQNPDGTATRRYQFADGSSRLDTLDPRTGALSVRRLDSDGKEIGEATTGKTLDKAAMDEFLLGPSSLAGEPFGRINADGTATIFNRFESGLTRVITVEPESGNVTTAFFNADGAPVGEPQVKNEPDLISTYLASAGGNPAQAVKATSPADLTIEVRREFPDNTFRVERLNNMTGKVSVQDFDSDGTPRGEAREHQGSQEERRRIENDYLRLNVANRQSRVLADGTMQEMVKHNDGGIEVQTLDTVSNTVLVESFDGDGKPAGGSRSYSLDAGTMERRANDIRSRHENYEGRIYPDGSAEKRWVYPDGSSRIDRFDSEKASIVSTSYDSAGKPAGEPVVLGGQAVSGAFMASVRAHLPVPEGTVYPDGRMELLSTYADGRRLQSVLDPATGKLTVSLLNSKGQPLGEPVVSEPGAAQILAFSDHVRAKQPPVEGKVYPDGRVEQTRRYADGRARLDSFDPATGVMQSRLVDAEGAELVPSMEHRSPEQKGRPTETQLARVEDLVKEIVDGGGEISPSCHEHLESLLEDAGNEGCRDSVEAALQDRLAASSSYRLHISDPDDYSNFASTGGMTENLANGNFDFAVTRSRLASEADIAAESTPAAAGDAISLTSRRPSGQPGAGQYDQARDTLNEIGRVKADDPEAGAKINTAFDKLAESAAQGNPYAREALLSILSSSAEQSDVYRRSLKIKAAMNLDSSVGPSGKLSDDEARALGDAILDARRAGDTTQEALYSKIVDRAFTGDGHEQAEALLTRLSEHDGSIEDREDGQAVLGPDGELRELRLDNGTRQFFENGLLRRSVDGDNRTALYEDGGRLETERLPDGEVRRHSPDGTVSHYDHLGNLTRVDTANHQTRTFEWSTAADGSLFVSRIAESGGTEWTSADGRTYRQSQSDNAVSGRFFAEASGRYGFDIDKSDGSTVRVMRDLDNSSVVMARGSTAGSSWQENLRIGADGSRIARDSQGRLLETADAVGHRMEFKRDDNGVINEIRETDGSVWKSEDGVHFVQETDQGKVTRELTVDEKDGSITTIDRDESGAIARTTTRSPDGSTLVRDGENRPVLIQDRYRHRTEIAYDGDGKMTVTRHGEKGVSVFQNSADMKVSLDDRGNLTVEEKDRTTVYQADGWQKVSKDGEVHYRAELPNGATVERNESLLVTSIALANGETRSFTYDSAGEMTSYTEPGGKVWTRSQDRPGVYLSDKGEEREFAGQALETGIYREKLADGSNLIYKTDGSSIAATDAGRITGVVEPDRLYSQKVESGVATLTAALARTPADAGTVREVLEGLSNAERRAVKEAFARDGKNLETELRKFIKEPDLTASLEALDRDHPIRSVHTFIADEKGDLVEVHSITPDGVEAYSRVTAGEPMSEWKGPDGKVSSMSLQVLPDGSLLRESLDQDRKRHGVLRSTSGAERVLEDGAVVSTTREDGVKISRETLALPDAGGGSRNIEVQAIRQPDGQTIYRDIKKIPPAVVGKKFADGTTMLFDGERVTRILDADGKVKGEFQYEVDNQGKPGKLKSFKLADGVTREVPRSHDGQVRFSMDETGKSVVARVELTDMYNRDRGDLIQYGLDGTKTLLDGSMGRRVYDPGGRLIESYNGKQKTGYHFSYDSRGNLKTIQREGGEVWTRTRTGSDTWKNSKGEIWKGKVSLNETTGVYEESSADIMGTHRRFSPNRDEQVVKGADVAGDVDAIERACNGGLLGIGTDTDTIENVLQDKSKLAREVMNRLYQERHGHKHGKNWDLYREFEDELSGSTLTRFRGMLRADNINDDYVGRLSTDLVEITETRFLGMGARQKEVIEQEIRDTLRDRTRAEIVELDREFTESQSVLNPESPFRNLEDAVVNNDNLTEKTRAFNRIYMKGVENRTDQDFLRMAQVAIDAGDLQMFQETWSRAPESARELFRGEVIGGTGEREGDRKIREAFGSIWSSTNLMLARDALEYGERSLATGVHQNTSIIGDSESEIEKIATNLPPEQRELYRRGRELVLAGRTEAERKEAGPRSASEQTLYDRGSYLAENPENMVEFPNPGTAAFERFSQSQQKDYLRGQELSRKRPPVPESNLFEGDGRALSFYREATREARHDKESIDYYTAQERSADFDSRAIRYYQEASARMNDAAGQSLDPADLLTWSRESQVNEYLNWDSLAVSGGENLLGSLSKHRGNFYDSSTHEVMSSIENMSISDWEHLRRDRQKFLDSGESLDHAMARAIGPDGEIRGTGNYYLDTVRTLATYADGSAGKSKLAPHQRDEMRRAIDLIDKKLDSQPLIGDQGAIEQGRRLAESGFDPGEGGSKEDIAAFKLYNEQQRFERGREAFDSGLSIASLGPAEKRQLALFNDNPGYEHPPASLPESMKDDWEAGRKIQERLGDLEYFKQRSFEDSRTSGNRDLASAIEDNLRWYDDKEDNIYKVIENMTDEDLRAWQADVSGTGIRKSVMDRLEQRLSAAELRVAEGLLAQAAEGKRPKMDVIDKLNRHAAHWDADEAQVVRDLQDAFREDPGLRDRINSPGSEQQIREAFETSLRLREDQRYLLGESRKNGTFDAELERQAKDLAVSPEVLRQALFLPESYKNKLSAAQKDSPESYEKTLCELSSQERSLSTALRERAREAVDEYDYNRYIKPLLETGRLELGRVQELSQGVFDFDQVGSYEDSARAGAAMTPAERELYAASGKLDRALFRLAPSERVIARNAFMQGEMRPEDKLRGYMVGLGTAEQEIKDVLHGLRNRDTVLASMQKDSRFAGQEITEAMVTSEINSRMEEVKLAYSRKYGANLNLDFNAEMSGQDLRDSLRGIRHEAETAREAAFMSDREVNQVYGLGTYLTDALGWDGTTQTMRDYHERMHGRLVEAAMNPDRPFTVEEARDIASLRFGAADASIDSQNKLVDTAVDAAITVAALLAAVPSGGGSMVAWGANILSKVPAGARVVAATTRAAELVRLSSAATRVTYGLSKVPMGTNIAWGLAGGTAKVTAKHLIVADHDMLSEGVRDFADGALNAFFVSDVGRFSKDVSRRAAGEILESVGRKRAGELVEAGERGLVDAALRSAGGSFLKEGGEKTLQRQLTKFADDAIKNQDPATVSKMLRHLASDMIRDDIPREAREALVRGLTRQLDQALEQAVRQEIAQLARAPMRQLLTEVAWNSRQGLLGGSAGSLARLDADQGLEANLQTIAMGGLMGMSMAGSFTVALKGVTSLKDLAFRPGDAGSYSAPARSSGIRESLVSDPGSVPPGLTQDPFAGRMQREFGESTAVIGLRVEAASASASMTGLASSIENLPATDLVVDFPANLETDLRSYIHGESDAATFEKATGTAPGDPMRKVIDAVREKNRLAKRVGKPEMELHAAGNDAPSYTGQTTPPDDLGRRAGSRLAALEKQDPNYRALLVAETDAQRAAVESLAGAVSSPESQLSAQDLMGGYFKVAVPPGPHEVAYLEAVRASGGRPLEIGEHQPVSIIQDGKSGLADSLDRSRLNTVAVAAGETATDVIDFLARTDPAFARQIQGERVIAGHNRIGRAAQDYNVVNFAGDGTASIEVTLDHLRLDGSIAGPLDYRVAVHELVGHRGFDNYMQQDPSRLATLNAIEAEYRTRNVSLTGDRTSYHQAPSELAAERIANEAVTIKLQNRIDDLIRTGQEIPADLAAEMKRLEIYRTELERQISYRPDDPKVAEQFDRYFADMREYMKQTFSPSMRQTPQARLRVNGDVPSDGVYTPRIERPGAAEVARIEAAVPALGAEAAEDFSRRMAGVRDFYRNDMTPSLARAQELNPEIRQTRRDLDAEIARLKKGGAGDADIEAARRDPSHSLNDDSPLRELDARWNERVREHADITARANESALERRDLLQQGLDDFVAARNSSDPANPLAPVTVQVAQHMHAAGGYAFGQGTIILPKADLLVAGGAPGLSRTTYHEMVHVQQDVDIIRNSIRATAREGKAMDAAAVRKHYKDATGLDLDEKWLATVADLDRSAPPLDAAQIERAQRLALAVRESKPVGARSSELGNDARSIDSRLKELKDPSDSTALNKMIRDLSDPDSGPALARRYYGEDGVPADVKDLMDQWAGLPKDDIGLAVGFKPGADARADATTMLESRLDIVNGEHRRLIDDYAGSPIEKEAYGLDGKVKEPGEIEPGRALPTSSPNRRNPDGILDNTGEHLRESLSPSADDFEKMSPQQRLDSLKQRVAGAPEPIREGLDRLLKLARRDREAQDVIDRVLRLPESDMPGSLKGMLSPQLIDAMDKTEVFSMLRKNLESLREPEGTTGRAAGPNWGEGDIPPLDADMRPSDPLYRMWMDNALARLELDADELAAFNQALRNGELQFSILDRTALDKIDGEYRLFSLEQGNEVKNQPYFSAGVRKVPLQKAEDYDPAVWPAATLVVRAPGPRGADNYYVVNGCRRVHVFGSETLNPGNRQIPVLLFDSPETFQRLLGHDPRNGIAGATPFRFERND
ncbi:MAG: RHS repeat protein [Candidatus Melainabacteria bacterium]|nr:RHS repeat protein [Candidatus Melainabacteria bacterium]